MFHPMPICSLFSKGKMLLLFFIYYSSVVSHCITKPELNNYFHSSNSLMKSFVVLVQFFQIALVSLKLSKIILISTNWISPILLSIFTFLSVVSLQYLLSNAICSLHDCCCYVKVAIDIEFAKNQFELHRKVNPTEVIVGW